MKILQLVSGREVNGAVMYSKLLSEQLVRCGHEVHMLIRPGSWLRDQLAPEVLQRESEMNRFPPFELWKTAKWIRQEKFDVIHSHMSRANMFGILMRLQTGVPVVATAHNRYFQLHWRFNDFVIANSRSTEAFQRRINGVSADKIRSIHCFVDLDRFAHPPANSRRRIRGELGLKPENFVVCVIGEVIQRKGHRYLFEALPELIRRIPDLKLVIIGRFHRDESYVRKLRQFQLRQGLLHRVKWLGRRNNVPEYLAAMDLLVVPSIEEPLGLVAVEAQAAGIPVIASATGGLPEIIDNRRTGVLVPPRNPEALVQAIDQLYCDPELRKSLSTAGRDSAFAKFATDRLSDEVVQIYEHLVRKKMAA